MKEPTSSAKYWENRERERILKYIERLAADHATSFVAWSARLSALAARIRKLRLR